MNVMLAEFSKDYGDSLSWIMDFFATGGFFMWCIIVCALVSVTVIIYQALALRRSTVLPPVQERELANIANHAASGDLGSLAQHLDGNPSPLARIARVGISHHNDVQSARDSVQATARDEVVKMEGGIPVLEVIITIAPLLGLLGTVSGLVDVFSVVGEKEALTSGAKATMADGIAKALYTTIAGLVVAIPTVVANSYFAKKIERMAVHMEKLMDHVVSSLHGGKALELPEED